MIPTPEQVRKHVADYSRSVDVGQCSVGGDDCENTYFEVVCLDEEGRCLICAQEQAVEERYDER